MSSLVDHSPPTASALLTTLVNGEASAPMPGPSPIPSFQLRELICGVETELLIQTFDDRIVVIVTQNGRMGCMVCRYRSATSQDTDKISLTS